MTEQILQIMIPAVIAGILTFIVVESLAFADDKSGFRGLFWGTILSVLVSSIVALSILLVKVGIL